MSRNNFLSVSQIDLKTGEEIAVFKNALHAAKSTGNSQGNISACIRGKQKTCGGYYWKAVQDKETLLNIDCILAKSSCGSNGFPK